MTLTEGEPQKGGALEIAGIRISWLPELKPGGSVHHPLKPDAHSDVVLCVRDHPPPSIPKAEKTFDSGQTWALLQSESQLVLQDTSLHSKTPASRFLFLAPDLKSGDLYVTGDPPQDADP